MFSWGVLGVLLPLSVGGRVNPMAGIGIENPGGVFSTGTLFSSVFSIQSVD